MAEYKSSKKQAPAIKLKAQPNNEQLEQEILSIIINDQDVDEIVFDLKAEDFYVERNRIIYEKLRTKHSQSLPFDYPTLLSAFTDEEKDKIGGLSYINDVNNLYISSAKLLDYIENLKNLSRARKLLSISSVISEMAQDNQSPMEIISMAVESMNRIALDAEKKELEAVSSSANEVIDEIVDIYNTGEKPNALSTGYENLDIVANGGFLPGQMIVLAARPGCGKTSFAMSIAANISKNDPEKVIAVFNLEMSRSELIKRLVAFYAQIDSKKVSMNDLDSEQINKILDTKKIFAESNIFIDDSSNISAEEIKSKVARLKNKAKRLDLVIIDHMQLIKNTQGKSRYEQMTEISRMIKIIAKDINVPVLVLSQMSRKVEETDEKTQKDLKQKKPKMSDLRESGAIEQDADMIVFLTPDPDEASMDLEESTGAIIAFVAKNRAGASELDLKFIWHKDTMTFEPNNNKYPVKVSKDNSNKTSNAQEVEYNSTQYSSVDDMVITDDYVPLEDDYSIPSDYEDSVNI